MTQVVHRHELFFTPAAVMAVYIGLAHSRNYGSPALLRAFFRPDFGGYLCFPAHRAILVFNPETRSTRCRC